MLNVFFLIVGIVKRLLDAMKGEAVPETVLPYFMDAFETLVKSNLSPEVMRSLSLFITYAFHLVPVSAARTPRPLSAISRPSTPNLLRRPTIDGSGASTPVSGIKFLTKKQLGIRVLSLYSEILCEKDNLNNIRKFAKTVTNKVCICESLIYGIKAILTTISGFFTCSLKMMLMWCCMEAKFLRDS